MIGRTVEWGPGPALPVRNDLAMPVKELHQRLMAVGRRNQADLSE